MNELLVLTLNIALECFFAFKFQIKREKITTFLTIFLKKDSELT